MKTFVIYTFTDKYTIRNCNDEQHARQKLFDAYGIEDKVIFKVDEEI